MWEFNKPMASFLHNPSSNMCLNAADCGSTLIYDGCTTTGGTCSGKGHFNNEQFNLTGSLADKQANQKREWRKERKKERKKKKKKEEEEEERKEKKKKSKKQKKKKKKKKKKNKRSKNENRQYQR